MARESRSRTGKVVSQKAGLAPECDGLVAAGKHSAGKGPLAALARAAGFKPSGRAAQKGLARGKTAGGGKPWWCGGAKRRQGGEPRAEGTFPSPAMGATQKSAWVGFEKTPPLPEKRALGERTAARCQAARQKARRRRPQKATAGHKAAVPKGGRRAQGGGSKRRPRGTRRRLQKAAAGHKAAAPKGGRRAQGGGSKRRPQGTRRRLQKAAAGHKAAAPKGGRGAQGGRAGKGGRRGEKAAGGGERRPQGAKGGRAGKLWLGLELLRYDDDPVVRAKRDLVGRVRREHG